MRNLFASILCCAAAVILMFHMAHSKKEGGMDVVIVVADKDTFKLELGIPSLIRHSRTQIRNIYLVSQSAKPLVFPWEFIQVHEGKFPFSKQDLSNIFEKKGFKHPHIAWYYQQLLKLYAPRVIPDVLPNVLILDSDVVLSNDIEFFTQNGTALLGFGYPYHWYFNSANDLSVTDISHVHAQAAERLVPGWKIQSPYCGMIHHMPIQRRVLDDLFEIVEKHHGVPFYEAFLNSAGTSKWNGASEYILYFNFAVQFHPNMVRVRHLTTTDAVIDSAHPLASKTSIEQYQNIVHSLKREDVVQVGVHYMVNISRFSDNDFVPKDTWNQMEKVIGGAPGMTLSLNHGSISLLPFSLQDMHQKLN